MAAFKRLFFDIETSYCQGWFWRPSFKTQISYDQIIKQAAIICICYKWEGSDKVKNLQWNRGDDKEMVYKFAEIIKDADEVVGHNGDRFDLKWFRTRCLIHGIKSMPEIKSIDTLKISRSKFNFPSNRLDAIGKYLGFGGKKEHKGIDLWHDIIQRNSKKSMKEMIDYCNRDVELLEKVFIKLEGYTKQKTHMAVEQGGDRCDCPYCGSEETQSRRQTTLASGVIKHKLSCNKCKKYFTISASDFRYRTERKLKREISELNKISKSGLYLE